MGGKRGSNGKDQEEISLHLEEEHRQCVAQSRPGSGKMKKGVTIQKKPQGARRDFK